MRGDEYETTGDFTPEELEAFLEGGPSASEAALHLDGETSEGGRAMRDRMWGVEVDFTEDDENTRADVFLTIDDRRFHGWGRARRNPSDPDVPQIGEELAAARALSDLSHQLLDAAADAVSGFEGHAVRLHL